MKNLNSHIAGLVYQDLGIVLEAFSAPFKPMLSTEIGDTNMIRNPNINLQYP